jgi:hypothetical protein
MSYFFTVALIESHQRLENFYRNSQVQMPSKSPLSQIQISAFKNQILRPNFLSLSPIWPNRPMPPGQPGLLLTVLAHLLLFGLVTFRPTRGLAGVIPDHGQPRQPLPMAAIAHHRPASPSTGPGPRAARMTSPAICSPVFPPPSITPWNNSSSNGRGIKSPSPH